MSDLVLILIIWGVVCPVVMFLVSIQFISRAHDRAYELGVKHGRAAERDDRRLRSAEAAAVLGMAMFKTKHPQMSDGFRERR